MEESKTQNKRTYSRWSDMSVKVLSVGESPANRMVRGKAVIIPDEAEVTIVENLPRTDRSVEVGRSLNCRMVRRHDGNYTLTLRFGAKQKNLRESLLAQVRNMASIALCDALTCENNRKEASK